eukprot:TRINITY_DN55589_c0_g1_i1.p1 TRINITY_DN55589_c0_g1~~TRINITY_DN55589_c0_g1_i1.p1  ORF type:complete len:301 (+),score=54.65 TRINITY_DN55589_c0_g1_i1:82-984(+)
MTAAEPAACREDQRQEVEALAFIYDDIVVEDEEGSGIIVYAPVPYEETLATVVFTLPDSYPVEPIRTENVGIEGVPDELTGILLGSLQLQGYLASESTSYERSGEPILHAIIASIRHDIAWRPTEEEMSQFIAEANEEEPEEEVDCSEIDAEWQKYEMAKKAEADAKRKSKQQSSEPVDDVIAVAGPKLTGYEAFKARLLAGETVGWRSGGNSLAPLIKSRDHCTYAPVSRHEDIKKGDVVFCQIGSRYWEHMVKKKMLDHPGRDGEPDVYIYTISNIHGHENGDTRLEKIYGRCVAVHH